jgi:hypothetical protein
MTGEREKSIRMSKIGINAFAGSYSPRSLGPNAFAMKIKYKKDNIFCTTKAAVR